MRYVVDASVTLAWAVPDEQQDLADRFFRLLDDDSELFVPSVWPFEVSNVLTMRERFGRMTRELRETVNQLVLQLPIVVVQTETQEVLEEAVNLAVGYSLTAYDAAYLHVALRQRLPLATLDSRLSASAAAAGCEVFA